MKLFDVLSQVALHLLTEREKNDLAQLVDTMVSYSLKYRTSNPAPLQKFHKHGAVSDASELSFDPPVDEFVRFQVVLCPNSNYIYLILVHDVD